MPPMFSRTLSLSLVILGLLAGCNALQQPAAVPTADPTAAPAAPAATNSASTPEAATPAAAAESDLPKGEALKLQVHHPNGTVLNLTHIDYYDDHISVAFKVTNGYKEQINLNDSDDLVLTDNLGNTYNLSPLPNNPTVKVPPHANLEGTFQFLGGVAPDATSVTVTTNAKYGSDKDYANHPQMTFNNIPLKRGSAS